MSPLPMGSLLRIQRMGSMMRLGLGVALGTMNENPPSPSCSTRSTPIDSIMK